MAIMMRYGIIILLDSAKQVLIEEKSRLRGLGVDRAGIFGSVVRGEEKPESNVDILLEHQPGHHLTLLSLEGHGRDV